VRWIAATVLCICGAAPVVFTLGVIAFALDGGNALGSRGLTAPSIRAVGARISSETSTHGSVGARVRNASPQPGWEQSTQPVPILEFHELGRPPASDPLPELYVSDSAFVAEMRWLDRHGYQAVTLDEVMAAWYHHGTLPEKPVVITFDNGYVPQATFAPAVLSRFGWPGVLNEITANHLAPWRLRRLISIGWEVDSHSVTHPDLTTLNPVELRYQVASSRRFLQRTFGIPVESFCYPSNRYDPAVVEAVEDAGYRNALTENPGYASRAHPFLLDRFEITGGVAQVAADLSSRR
jgi:peptidoglycan/xylan/chitin deacetylase (PgdA/CDA1 family)